MNILTSRSHGILDYIFSLFVLVAPTLFQMEGDFCTATYVLGVVHLVITALTRFEFGLIKLIPFRIHGLIEVVMALLLVGLAFWFNSRENEFAFYLYLALSAITLVVFSITDFKTGGLSNTGR